MEIEPSLLKGKEDQAKKLQNLLRGDLLHEYKKKGYTNTKNPSKTITTCDFCGKLNHKKEDAVFEEENQGFVF